MTKDEMIHMMSEFGATVANSIMANFEEFLLPEMEELLVKHNLSPDAAQDIVYLAQRSYAIGIHDASEHAMDASKLAMRLIENEEDE